MIRLKYNPLRIHVWTKVNLSRATHVDVGYQFTVTRVPTSAYTCLLKNNITNKEVAITLHSNMDRVNFKSFFLNRITGQYSYPRNQHRIQYLITIGKFKIRLLRAVNDMMYVVFNKSLYDEREIKKQANEMAIVIGFNDIKIE